MAAKRSRPAASADAVFDELLVTLVRGGDRRAAERLAARWQPRLLRTARRLTGDTELAMQAAQDSWLGIWRGLPGLRDPARFAAWAFGIVRRKCADAVRRQSNERDRSNDSDVDDFGTATTPDDSVAIAQAFAMLSPEQRFAAHLYFVEGLTLAEIAGAQEVPLGTAKSRLFHARRQLKAALGEQTSGEDT